MDVRQWQITARMDVTVVEAEKQMTGSILIIQHRNRGYQKGARAEQGGDGAQKQGFAKLREKYVQDSL